MDTSEILDREAGRIDAVRQALRAMSAICHHDWKAALNCLAQLYECADLEQFARVTLNELPKLVGSDHSTFNYVAPSVPKVSVLAWPEVANHGERQRIFARYISDHPVLNHYLATGDGAAYKISDFQSVREYHALPLYQHFYRELRYEDQMAIELFPPAAELISIALARSRRSFTERDRELLNTLRPHLARAYRHVEKIALLKRNLESREPASNVARVTSVILDARDRPVHFGPMAREWIERFFPGSNGTDGRLPDTVAKWLRRARRPATLRAGEIRRRDVLKRDREGERLQLRLISDPATGARILVMGLETLRGTAHAALSGRLTVREVEVLLQVEQGKTNDEVAAALGISPLTVRTHLEHIFEKLHVPSRTAAVTRFRQMCSVSGGGQLLEKA